MGPCSVSTSCRWRLASGISRALHTIRPSITSADCQWRHGGRRRHHELPLAYELCPRLPPSGCLVSGQAEAYDQTRYTARRWQTRFWQWAGRARRRGRPGCQAHIGKRASKVREREAEANNIFTPGVGPWLPAECREGHGQIASRLAEAGDLASRNWINCAWRAFQSAFHVADGETVGLDESARVWVEVKGVLEIR